MKDSGWNRFVAAFSGATLLGVLPAIGLLYLFVWAIGDRKKPAVIHPAVDNAAWTNATTPTSIVTKVIKSEDINEIGVWPKTPREIMFFEDGARWGFIATSRGIATSLNDIVPRTYELKREGDKLTKELNQQLDAARRGP